MCESHAGKRKCPTFDSVLSNLKCNICLGVLRQPRLHASCGQMFCAHCLDKWSQSSTSQSSKIKLVCPLCKGDNRYTFIEAPKAIKNLLHHVNILKLNKRRRCAPIYTDSSILETSVSSIETLSSDNSCTMSPLNLRSSRRFSKSPDQPLSCSTSLFQGHVITEEAPSQNEDATMDMETEIDLSPIPFVEDGHNNSTVFSPKISQFLTAYCVDDYSKRQHIEHELRQGLKSECIQLLQSAYAKLNKYFVPGQILNIQDQLHIPNTLNKQHTPVQFSHTNKVTLEYENRSNSCHNSKQGSVDALQYLLACN